MVLSNRQLRLVQAGAQVLNHHFYYSLDKGILIINQAIAAQQEYHGKSMDEVDQEDAHLRRRFIQGVVVRVRKRLIAESGASDEKIKRAIESFAKEIGEIWNES